MSNVDQSAVSNWSETRVHELVVLSLRYSSWSMRPWLALRHAGIPFYTRTVEIPELSRQVSTPAGPIPQQVDVHARRQLGSVNGLFPVLWVGEVPIHESLAIAEWAAEHHPHAGLWPQDWQRRAQARSVCAEMVSGFGAVRAAMSCHLFGSVPRFEPSPEVQRQLDRLFELWDTCLQRSGGPYLFGEFGIADCMYFPMLTRLVTYGIFLDATTKRYASALLENRAVTELIAVARSSPAIPAYDAYIESLSGDPTARIAIPYELP